MKTKTRTAARAQACRKEAGLTVEDLAGAMQAFSYTKNTVINIENGRKEKWSTGEMQAFASALSTTVGYLFPELTGDNNPASDHYVNLVAAAA